MGVIRDPLHPLLSLTTLGNWHVPASVPSATDTGSDGACSDPAAAARTDAPNNDRQPIVHPRIPRTSSVVEEHCCPGAEPRLTTRRTNRVAIGCCWCARWSGCPCDARGARGGRNGAGRGTRWGAESGVVVTAGRLQEWLPSSRGIACARDQPRQASTVRQRPQRRLRQRGATTGDGLAEVRRPNLLGGFGGVPPAIARGRLHGEPTAGLPSSLERRWVVGTTRISTTFP